MSSAIIQSIRTQQTAHWKMAHAGGGRLSSMQTFELIQLYHDHAPLWDVRNQLYKDRNVRNTAYMSIQLEFEMSTKIKLSGIYLYCYVIASTVVKQGGGRTDHHNDVTRRANSVSMHSWGGGIGRGPADRTDRPNANGVTHHSVNSMHAELGSG